MAEAGAGARWSVAPTVAALAAVTAAARSSGAEGGGVAACAGGPDRGPVGGPLSVMATGAPALPPLITMLGIGSITTNSN